MQETLNSAKLTPAAREAVQELTESFKSELLAKASNQATNASQTTPIIAVQDIFESYTALRPRFLEEQDRTLPLVEVTFGIVSGVLLSLAVNALADTTLSTTFTTLIVSLTLATLITAFMLIQRRQRKFQDTFTLTFPRSTSAAFANFWLVHEWQELEVVLRTIVAAKFGESKASAPSSVLITMLEESHAISAMEASYLREALQLRNAIVHGRGVEQTQSEYTELASHVASIRKRLMPIISHDRNVS
jgi:hypothetical protein